MALNSHYILDNEIEIVKADLKEFAIHYAIYRENIFFRQSWERRISIFAEDAPCYWITFKNRRIGGVCIEPNLLSSFFLETPFQDILRVLIPLKKFLIHCSDPSKPIEAFGILPYETEHFLRLGFLPSESRRVMIRPTEIFEPQEWERNLKLSHPAWIRSIELLKCCMNPIQTSIASVILEIILSTVRGPHLNITLYITKMRF